MGYGCFDRKPLATRAVVQDGWYSDGTTRYPKMIPIPDPMTKSCQYDRSVNDLGCSGCKHGKFLPAK